MAESRKAALLTTIEEAASQKVVMLDRRFDHSVDPEAEAARALGY